MGLGDIDFCSNDEKKTIEKNLFFLNSSGFQELKHLLFFETYENKCIEEIRSHLFLQIKTFFEEISKKEKIFFFIENFHDIDNGSLDCFKYFIENSIIDNKNINFILFTNEDFNLSENFFKLYYLKNYNEIIVKPNSQEELATILKPRFESVTNNYYYNALIKNSNGSIFYTDQLMHYFIENDVLKWDSEILTVNSKKLIPCPLTLEEIINKRLHILAKQSELFNLYLSLIILGPGIKFINILTLEFQGLNSKLNMLKNMDLIDYSQNSYVHVKNFNLFKDKALQIVDKNTISQLVTNIFNKLLPANKNVPVTLSEYLDFKNHDQKQWNCITEIAYNFGDVSAFIESSLRSIKNLPQNEFNKILPSVYEKIAKVSSDYYPDIALDYFKKALNDAIEKNNNDKIIELSKIMAKCSNLTGNCRVQKLNAMF